MTEPVLCLNCDEMIAQTPDGWVHVERVEGQDPVPCLSADIPIAEPPIGWEPDDAVPGGAS